MYNIYRKYDILPVFNIPYCPQFNPIESYFSCLKGEYKRLILKAIIEKKDFDPKQLIKRALKSINKVKI